MKPIFSKIWPVAAALTIATSVWLPCLHFFFTKPVSDFYQSGGISEKARQLSTRQLRLWTEPSLRRTEIAKMRAGNAEWDFMGRTFLVWSLANMGLREPSAKEQDLSVIDRIIDETVQIEKTKGPFNFLMPYARERPYLIQPPRSCFLDGEIALMMGARRMLQELPAYRKEMTGRLNLVERRMRSNPLLAMESYPDECWTYDHAVALAAFKVEDFLDGSNHSALCRDWVAAAKRRLVDPKSGMLVSAFAIDGQVIYGPEGSSIWMIAHCLQPVDGDFAQSQYEHARKELGRTLLGFGYALEWPASWRGPMDVDSGMVVPGLGVSAGSSGMAFIAAAAFHDWAFLQSLGATLDMAAFPERDKDGLRYCAGNQVGDAAILYASVLGPLWERIQR